MAPPLFFLDHSSSCRNVPKLPKARGVYGIGRARKDCCRSEVELRDSPATLVYQRIAAAAAGMPARGVRVAAITRQFGVDHHTADEAIRWFRRW